MEIILSDFFEETLSPLFAFKPAFDWPTAVFSPLERILKADQTGKNFSALIVQNSRRLQNRRQNFYENYLASKKRPLSKFQLSEKQQDPAQVITPDSLLSNFAADLSKDTSLLKRSEYPLPGPPVMSGISYEGEKNNLWLHPQAKLSPMVSINTEDGPVIIDKNARVSSFCILKGPLYIGEGAILDRVLISHSRVGRQCRLGGEISDSFIGDFSNKHHEGFLGHSLVGDWVNLGALTTTSDLKNNYGKIKLQYKDKNFSTGRIKFGSIIGDFVKTGIGTMLNTGTIIDTAALLYSGFPLQKYYPAFFWGGAAQKYELEKFFTDLQTIMARRKQTPDSFLKEQISELYHL